MERLPIRCLSIILIWLYLADTELTVKVPRHSTNGQVQFVSMARWTPTMSQHGVGVGLPRLITAKCCARPTTEPKATDNGGLRWREKVDVIAEIRGLVAAVRTAENGRRKIRVKIFWCNGLKCVPLQADYVQKTSIGRSPTALLAECRRWL